MGVDAGNLCSILVSGFVCTVISLIKPDNFDWKATREITMIDPEDTGAHLWLPRGLTGLYHTRRALGKQRLLQQCILTLTDSNVLDLRQHVTTRFMLD